MEQAWLDSLSEDWSSKSPSAGSPSPHLPPLKNLQGHSRRLSGSKIPRPRTSHQYSSSVGARESSFQILSERSASEVNIRAAAAAAAAAAAGTGTTGRPPSKLVHEIELSELESSSGGGDAACDRAASKATIATNGSEFLSGSVVRNTVQIRSPPPLSPDRAAGAETPEWRRRLVNGQVAYGEQRDLFSSAATGLENFFKPPPPQSQQHQQRGGGEPQGGPAANGEPSLRNSSFASSPPAWKRLVTRGLPPDGEDEETGSAEDDQPDQSPSPSPRRPRQMRYRANEPLNTRQDPSIDSSQQRSELWRPVSSSRSGAAAAGADNTKSSSLTVPQPDSRKTSGQSDTRNEDFSAISLEKHVAGDGKIDFTPAVKPDQLRERLERLRLDQIAFDSSPPKPPDFDETGHGDDGQTGLDTTEAYERNAGFINLHRGSAAGVDGSSFLHKPLSSGLATDTSEMLPEDSLQASTPKQFPSVRVEDPIRSFRPSLPSPPAPPAPFPSPQKASSASPLKLFGPYDTFTNQTLMRRISQFEEDQASGSGAEEKEQDEDEDAEGEGDREPDEEEYRSEFDETPAPRKMPLQNTPHPARTRTASRLGHGGMEGPEFGSDAGSESDHGSGDGSDPGADKENIDPALVDITPRFRFSVTNQDSSPPPEPAEQLPVQRKRQRSATSEPSPSASPPGTLPSGIRPAFQDARLAAAAALLLATPQRYGDLSPGDGKRPRGSPARDPTPKRRRTLHRSDIAYGHDRLPDSAQSSHGQIDTSGFDQSPYQSQMSVIAPGRQFVISAPWRTRPNMGFLDEVARKPSIKTQDFLDEAGKIMAMIRSQVRRPDDSNGDHGAASAAPGREEDGDDSFQDSTREPFSRPPSREGAAPVTHAPREQIDPELISKLKQYQELSDMGDVITSSIRSVGLARDAVRADQEIERQLRSSCGSDDDQTAKQRSPGSEDGSHPNHVADDKEEEGPPEDPPKEFHEGPQDRPDYPSSLSAQSTNRTIHTGSSSKTSEKKKQTIAPQSVSHLIPDEIGSMYLDRENKRWMRKPRGHSHSHSQAPSRRRAGGLACEDSEDDPFASIPDLSVDTLAEMQNLRLASPQRRPGSGGGSGSSGGSGSATPGRRHDGLPASPSPSPRGYVTLSPDAALTPEILSQAREELNKLEIKSSSGRPSAGREDDEEVERELSISDRRPTPPRRKGLTITFSSPIASIIQDVVVVAEDIDELEDDEPDTAGLGRDMSESAAARLQSSRPRSAFRAPTRQISVGGQSFETRPVSRIEEREDEEETLAMLKPLVLREGATAMTAASTKTATTTAAVAATLNTPGKRALAAVDPNAGAILADNVGNLSLSPLSEFTMHSHHDHSSFGPLEVSYVLGDRYLVTGDGTARKRVLSATIRELVSRLSEVEPHEPFWEAVEEVDLRDKRLSSLHTLDEFCGRLVTLDVSRNALAHLEGVPVTVRELKVAENRLSELTSWDHLRNLQYVDVSNNEIKSLSGLRQLVHLRSLRADSNRLTSLDGLDRHDGLLHLRARDNDIAEIDFSVVRLSRLTELDLAGNRIAAVRGLEELPRLAALRLQRNRLETFDAAALARPHPSLRHVDLSDNRLRHLDLSMMPALHLLHVDRNRLAAVTGFGRTRGLDSLSLREQQPPQETGFEPLDLSFLTAACEVRKLFLSGNRVGPAGLDPLVRVDFLNLQLLEVANCGLAALPARLGQLMPNLRTINVNFNAIADLSPIRFIPRLKKLLAAGNRLSDSGEVTSLLTEFPHLTRLDLRDNPVTQGFYPPLPSQPMTVSTADGSGPAPDHPFCIRDADPGRDGLFAGRLDSATGMRRRLYGVVFVGSCRRLRTLDGLPVDRAAVLAGDEEYLALVREGLLPEGGDGDGSRVGRIEQADTSGRGKQGAARGGVGGPGG